VANKPSEQPLAEVLEELMNHYRMKNGISLARIKAAYAHMMGPVITRHTREIRLIQRKLYLYIESPALRQELSYGRDKIRRMVNEELREDYLEEVIIK